VKSVVHRLVTACWFFLLSAVSVVVIVGCSGGKNTTSETAGTACGVERWPVKTLSDEDAARVSFQPKPSSVAALRALTPPSALPADRRIAPTELTTFTVRARVQEFKLEDDNDIHVVVNEPGKPNDTMVIELVDPQCKGAVHAVHRDMMQTARNDFLGICGELARRFKDCEADVEVTGVGFFDSIHGQAGVAPNGIELHPVLEIRLVQ